MSDYLESGTKERFIALTTEAANCRLCPAMCGRSAVLSELNGRLDARVMFIGEAPGRKGADRTRIPFSGDQSGKNFDRFLASIGLKRSQIFITSAALCNPRTTTGANPTANCQIFSIDRTFTAAERDGETRRSSFESRSFRTRRCSRPPAQGSRTPAPGPRATPRELTCRIRSPRRTKLGRPFRTTRG